MSNYKIVFLFKIFIFAVVPNIKAQTVNWSAIGSAKNNARMYSGLDYGVTYGLQYGRVIPTKSMIWIPVVAVSLPWGENLLDDYSWSVGTTTKVFQYKSWIASFDVSIVSKQNKNPFVTMRGVGSESGIHFGYYKQRWFVNLHFSTDNTYLTHFNHTDVYRGNFADAKDGWYQNTANNQYLGINTGYSFSKMDLTFSSGLRRTDGLRSKPTLPLSMKLGVNYRF